MSFFNSFGVVYNFGTYFFKISAIPAVPRMARSHFDAVECWGFSLAIRSFWCFFFFYAIFLFDIVMKVEWTFVVNGDCSNFRGFNFGGHSFSVFKKSMWMNYQTLNYHVKQTSGLAYLWITGRRHSPAVYVLISPCFEDTVKANEIAQEWNIICQWEKGAKTKRTFSSLWKTATWQWKRQKKLLSSPPQSLSNMTQVSEAQF